MQFDSFDRFARKIAAVPAREVLNALDLKCKILQDDLGTYRSAFTEDAFSILCFRQFLRSARMGSPADFIRSFPADHIELYKQLVVRLVKAGELPPSAMEWFDTAFVVAAYS